MEAGVCDPQVPQIVASEILGSHALYSWSARNSAICMAEASDTHGLAALGRIQNLVALNSALEVDLYGQVNSEMLGGRQAGGVGGSLDFAMGAQFDGGRLIVALRSTTSSGASRIVPQLTGVTTIPRTLMQFVVTEHGVADLRQATDRDRAEALIAVADPEHRAMLRAGQPQ